MMVGLGVLGVDGAIYQAFDLSSVWTGSIAGLGLLLVILGAILFALGKGKSVRTTQLQRVANSAGALAIGGNVGGDAVRGDKHVDQRTQLFIGPLPIAHETVNEDFILVAYDDSRDPADDETFPKGPLTQLLPIDISRIYRENPSAREYLRSNYNGHRLAFEALVVNVDSASIQTATIVSFKTKDHEPAVDAWFEDSIAESQVERVPPGTRIKVIGRISSTGPGKIMLGRCKRMFDPPISN